MLTAAGMIARGWMLTVGMIARGWMLTAGRNDCPWMDWINDQCGEQHPISIYGKKHSSFCTRTTRWDYEHSIPQNPCRIEFFPPPTRLISHLECDENGKKKYRMKKTKEELDNT